MIEVQGLTKHYGSVRAVDGLDFRIERGEIVGFLGPNGAGKSTTMRMLTGCLAPDAGTVRIAGGADPVSRPEVRRRVGYLPESTPLYRAMRVDRYLDFAARLLGMSRRERPGALHRVAVATGLRDHLGRRIEELSKGYRQRVGLAQALLGDPDVLVLDEPTSGLDPVEIQRIRALVRELGESRTVLLSTHVLSEVAEVCGRVLILARGRLVADGAPDDLVRSERVTLRVAARGADDSLARALATLSGVRSAKELASPEHGVAAFQLELEPADPRTHRALAEAAGRAVAAAGAAIVELRLDAPTLERVFLSRTDPSAGADRREAS